MVGAVAAVVVEGRVYHQFGVVSPPVLSVARSVRALACLTVFRCCWISSCRSSRVSMRVHRLTSMPVLVAMSCQSPTDSRMRSPYCHWRSSSSVRYPNQAWPACSAASWALTRRVMVALSGVPLAVCYVVECGVGGLEDLVGEDERGGGGFGVFEEVGQAEVVLAHPPGGVGGVVFAAGGALLRFGPALVTSGSCGLGASSGNRLKV